MNFSRYISSFLFLSMLVTASSLAKAAQTEEVCVSKVCFEKEIKKGDETLYLAGIAKKKVMFFKAYTAGLYLRDLKDEKSLDQEKKLILKYHRKVKKRSTIKHVRKMAKIPEVNKKEMEPKLRKFLPYLSPVNKKDTVEFWHQPQKGISLFKNGKEEKVIQDEEFSQDFFALWISPNAKDTKMQRKLMQYCVF